MGVAAIIVAVSAIGLGQSADETSEVILLMDSDGGYAGLWWSFPGQEAQIFLWSPGPVSGYRYLRHDGQTAYQLEDEIWLRPSESGPEPVDLDLGETSVVPMIPWTMSPGDRVTIERRYVIVLSRGGQARHATHLGPRTVSGCVVNATGGCQ